MSFRRLTVPAAYVKVGDRVYLMGGERRFVTAITTTTDRVDIHTDDGGIILATSTSPVTLAEWVDS